MKKKMMFIPFLFVIIACLVSCSYHIHHYTETIVAPTCVEDGYSLFTCECGVSFKSRIVTKVGHTIVVDEGYPCDCTNDGLSDGSHCSVCGEVIEKQEVIPHGHDWEYDVLKPATCEEEGIASGMVCKRCGVTETKETVIPSLGHEYKVSEKKNSNGHSCLEHECSRCHNIYRDSLTVDYTKNYDYVELTTNSLYKNHAEIYKKMYKTFYDACMKVFNSKTDYKKNTGEAYVILVTFEYSKGAMSQNEAYNVTDAFMKNNPQFYFLSSTMYHMSNTAVESISLAIDEPYFKASERKKCENNIKKMEREVYKSYLEMPNKDDYHKAKLIHDYIIHEIDYAYKNGRPSLEPIAHNIISVADGDNSTNGVCEAYSKTYLYLSNLLDLESIIVLGVGKGQNHGWNYTKINNKWYGVDTTWDDTVSGSVYDYFLAGMNTMNEDHIIGSTNVGVTIGREVFQVELPTLAYDDYKA